MTEGRSRTSQETGTTKPRRRRRRMGESMRLKKIAEVEEVSKMVARAAMNKRTEEPTPPAVSDEAAQQLQNWTDVVGVPVARQGQVPTVQTNLMEILFGAVR